MRTLSDIMYRAQGPEGILTRARAHARLQRHLLAGLPTDFAGHLRVACVRETTLVVAADSPAWATRLKTHNNELLSLARSGWRDPITRIKVIVADH